MIDFHSHILPQIDDGSADVAESLGLLAALAEQGVDAVAATPHFYADHRSVNEFLARRQESYERLSASLSQDSPRILLGAEVRYYEGISRLKELRSLRLGDSKLLLLEMPFAKWTEYTVREVVDLSCDADLQPVLAHVDRYWRYADRSTWERLWERGVLMQINADSLLRRGTRRRALRMLKNGTAQLLGSDCHNLSDRLPRMQQACTVIEKSLGKDFLRQMKDFASAVLA